MDRRRTAIRLAGGVAVIAGAMIAAFAVPYLLVDPVPASVAFLGGIAVSVAGLILVRRLRSPVRDLYGRLWLSLIAYSGVYLVVTLARPMYEQIVPADTRAVVAGIAVVVVAAAVLFALRGRLVDGFREIWADRS
jgi:hypothetical protein